MAKHGGRVAGVPNKVTTQVKDIILDVFLGLGGLKAMTVWAQENQGDFYTKVFTKLLPLQVKVTDETPYAKALQEAEERLKNMRQPPAAGDGDRTAVH